MLHRYGFETADLLLEEREEGILIRRREDVLLSWEDTFQEMAGEDEGWEDFEVTLLDGLTNDAPDSEEV